MMAARFTAKSLVTRFSSPVGRRARWSLVDQALSSLTNMAVSVFVARVVGPNEFGAFALAFATYLLALNAGRAFASQPLVIRHSASPADVRWLATLGSTGAAVILGITVAIPLGIVGLTVGGPTGGTLAALAVCLPGLLLQDAWRYSFFTSSEPTKAVINDGIWVIVQVLLFSLLVITHTQNSVRFVLAWGAAATVAGFGGCLQTRCRPNFRGGIRWFKSHSDIAPMLAVEMLATAGVTQIAFFCLAAAAGVETVGAIRAASLLFGPLNVVWVGAIVVILPEVVRLHSSAPSRLFGFSVALAIGMAGISLAMGSVVFFLPSSVGHALLGTNWLVARPIVPAVTLQVVASAVLATAALPMRVLEAVRQTMSIRLILVPLTVGAYTAGGVLAGAAGATLCGAGVTGLGAWLAWRQAIKAMRYESLRA